MKRGINGVLTALFVITGVNSAWAADAPPQLRVRTAGGRTTFHQGERISLELDFTGSSTYTLNNASYDRSGRMDHDWFDVSPKVGWVDPLAEYFDGRAVMGGGLFGEDTLSSKPETIDLNLNEWVRFDEPGDYTVVVHSRRVNAVKAKEAVPLTSNAIQLHVVPATADWERTKLAEIVAALKEPEEKDEEQPKLAAAVEDLRFLASEAAVKEMVQHLRDDEPKLGFDCLFGLEGLSKKLRPAALDALGKAIGDPDFPVSASSLEAVADLKMSEPGIELTSDAVLAREAEREMFMADAWAEALEALPSKRGTAHAVTAQTLVDIKPANATPEMLAQVGLILGESLLKLPADVQIAELAGNWDLLQGADILPTLQKLARLPMREPYNRESENYERLQLKSAALRRWYELDPEGAHAEILRQIGSAHPELTAEAIEFLPRENLPQFEAIWAREFMAEHDDELEGMFAALLAAFGDGSSAGMLASKAEKLVGRWACSPQAAALGYLVEFDTDAATPLVKRAVDARQQTGCYKSTFIEISQYGTGKALVQAAIESLDDHDPEVVEDAVRYLQQFGDESARKPLWAAYLKWSERWGVHGNELGDRGLDNGAKYMQDVIGRGLAEALISNQGWLADGDSIAAVAARCAGDEMCKSVKRAAEEASKTPLDVSFDRFGEGNELQIGQYHPLTMALLGAKAVQYPSGTKFRVVDNGGRGLEQDRVKAKVKALLEKAGMTVVE